MPTAQEIQHEKLCAWNGVMQGDLYDAKERLLATIMALEGLSLLAWETDNSKLPWPEIPYESILRECSCSIDFILEKIRNIQNVDDKKAASYGFDNLTDNLLTVQIGFKPLFESIYPEEERIISGFYHLLWIVAKKFTEVEKIEQVI